VIRVSDPDQGAQKRSRGEFRRSFVNRYTGRASWRTTQAILIGFAAGVYAAHMSLLWLCVTSASLGVVATLITPWILRGRP